MIIYKKVPFVDSIWNTDKPTYKRALFFIQTEVNGLRDKNKSNFAGQFCWRVKELDLREDIKKNIIWNNKPVIGTI